MCKELANKIFSSGKRFFQSAGIIRFYNSYPPILAFLKDRISIKRFTGFPLTMLLAALLANLLLMMDFTPDVINSKEFVVIDQQVSQWLYLRRNPALAAGFSWFTRLCDTKFVIILMLGATVILLVKRKFHYLAALLIAMFSCGITIYLSKNIFQVDRPLHLAYNHEYSFSFPSGHATISVALYGSLIYFLVRNTASLKLRFWAFAVAIAFSLLIGFSRLYLCAHYLSDVLGGYLLGTMWLLLTVSAFEWMRYAKSKSSSIVKAIYLGSSK